MRRKGRRRTFDEGAREKPDGGFHLMSVVQLCMAWWAYRWGHIRRFDLRVYFACHELVAEREAYIRDLKKRGERTSSAFKPKVRIDELRSMVGGGEESARAAEYLRASLRRLVASGLLSFRDGWVHCATSPDQLRVEELDTFWEMVGKVENNRRKVPVPRRMLRLMASGMTRVTTATLLAHFLRCLYFTRGICRPSGAVKASWVADVFGVNEREVKRARKHLSELTGGVGLLRIAAEHPQWELNRTGLWVTINLTWDRADAVDKSAVGEGRRQARPAKSPPPHPTIPAKYPPPDSYSELPTGTKDQKPGGNAPRPPAGAYASKGNGRKPQRDARRARDFNIEPRHLSETGALLELYEQLCARGAIVRSTTDQRAPSQLDFVALAEHARVVGSRNPAGLFAELLRRRRWHFITHTDEDAANRRIKHHLHGEPIARSKPPRPRQPELSELSDDAQVVRALRAQLRGRGMDDETIFQALKRQSQEWTLERWKAAVHEFDDWKLGGLTACAETSFQSVLKLAGKYAS